MRTSPKSPERRRALKPGCLVFHYAAAADSQGYHVFDHPALNTLDAAPDFDLVARSEAPPPQFMASTGRVLMAKTMSVPFFLLNT